MRHKKYLRLIIAVAAFFIGFSGWFSLYAQDTFSIALTGDSIITRKLSAYEEPEYLKMIQLLRSADIAITNLEVLFHDYEPYPMHQSGGTYMRADPVLAEELVWAGFDIVARANNHSGDYGVEGMRLTTRYVESAGLVHAGVGESLSEAREARFLDTAKGRVAFISCASTFPDHSRAGKARGGVTPRPGLNPLRYSSKYILSRDTFAEFKNILSQLGVRSREGSEEIRFLRQRFIAGVESGIQTEVDTEDLKDISAVIGNASRMADYTIVSLHAHERKKSRSVPADFLVSFAHTAVEAGADVVFGHGPHVLRGIEIYKGKPIFYSLGDFIFENETLLRLPAENYEAYDLGPEAHVADFNDKRYDLDRRGFPATREIWESVIAVPHFRGEDLVEVKLYPISLGFGKPRTERGRPLFADPELSRKIVDDLKRLSEPFGTSVEFIGGIGVIKLQAK